jgi:heat shock protein HslJ
MTMSDPMCGRGVRVAPLAVALLALAACAVPGAGADRDVRGAWRIEQARTEPMLDKRLARLDFGTDGRLTGHTSCNRLSAPYTLQGDRIEIGRVVTTRMACVRLLMEQEDRVLTALELARTARVRPDGLLELRDEDGRGVLRATRLADGP